MGDGMWEIRARGGLVFFSADGGALVGWWFFEVGASGFGVGGGGRVFGGSDPGGAF
ncbi:MAG: hypothetical protein RI897_2688 [Verrucomicrobiota bacterium]